MAIFIAYKKSVTLFLIGFSNKIDTFSDIKRTFLKIFDLSELHCLMGLRLRDVIAVFLRLIKVRHSLLVLQLTGVRYLSPVTLAFGGMGF